MSKRFRHAVHVNVTPELIVDFVTDGYQPKPFRCVKGLPKGAKLTGAHWDSLRCLLALRFEHPSLPKVVDGTMPDEIFPIYETIPCTPPTSPA